MKILKRLRSIILDNIGNIQCRLSNQSEIIPRNERNLKREKENLTKSEKRKQNCFKSKVSEMVKELTNNKFSSKNLIDKETKISIHDLNLNITLTARFHS